MWPDSHLRWVSETRPHILELEPTVWSGAGKLWLFRSPWPAVSMEEVLRVFDPLAASWDVETDPGGRALDLAREVQT